ncbi:MAG: RMD1 family protein [Gemmataceae bacterium]
MEASNVPGTTQTPELDALRTVTTPVSVDAARLHLQAEYFPSPIPLAPLQASYRERSVLCADPLVIKLAGNAHAVVLGFGAVVFWECDAALAATLREEIRTLLHGTAPSEVRDEALILLDQPEERVGFREIRLGALSLEHMKVISGTLGQSVALKHSELSVAQALKSTAPIVQALETRGALVPAATTIVKTVGFTLSVREAILARLSLFDDPAEAWRSERLARLHALLYEHFDIKKRLSTLEKKIAFLSDLNLTLMNLLQTRTSHRLEWIVILLIVIEVLFSIYHFFAG